MDPEGSICNPLDLESMLSDKKAKPRYLRISLLESITNNFSDDLVLGSGGFAVVYKGLLQNAVVAVKKLTQMLDVHEERFREEVDCLMRVKHKNIVRFLGYCSDTQGKIWEVNGKTVMAEERQRFLCFEYLPGNLDKYIKDQLLGHEWTTCYQIIKGICEGVHYLHQKKIVHLDLKPANILLGHDMVPKIADFGLSKRFDEDQTHHITSNPVGSQGYMAPEFFGGLFTFKSDIYSLGIIIIEILTGNKGYPDIDTVLQSWSIKFKTSPEDTQLEPVRICTEIGIECTDFNPAKRPDTWNILEMLDEMESKYGVFEMVDKAPYLLQGITSGVPMGQGLTRPEVTCMDSLGDMIQPGNVHNTNHQRAIPLRNEPSPSYNVDPNRNTLQQYAQDPSDRNNEQMYHGSHFQQDTATNYFEENAGTGDSQVYKHDNKDYSPDDDPLPGIEGFQIIGEPRPGFTLTACGFPTNGTKLCHFQWVRYLEDGTRQSIEDATMHDYVVTADDVGTLLAVDCTPMDDSGRQGDLVREFANNESKIACDPEMQIYIGLYLLNMRADFAVYVLNDFYDTWELATLTLKQLGYQIKLKRTGKVMIGENFSPNLQTKIPNGRTTQFVLLSSGDIIAQFNTHAITDNKDCDVRLRDLIVLVMRTFQSKALDAKSKGKA